MINPARGPRRPAEVTPKVLEKKIKKVKKRVDIFGICGILFAVMRDRMKNQHIDWLNAQDTKQVVAPVEGTHEGYRVVKAVAVRDLQQDDFASPVDEDCGWFGYEGLCED